MEKQLSIKSGGLKSNSCASVFFCVALQGTMHGPPRIKQLSAESAEKRNFGVAKTFEVMATPRLQFLTVWILLAMESASGLNL